VVTNAPFSFRILQQNDHFQDKLGTNRWKAHPKRSFYRSHCTFKGDGSFGSCLIADAGDAKRVCALCRRLTRKLRAYCGWHAVCTLAGGEQVAGVLDDPDAIQIGHPARATYLAPAAASVLIRRFCVEMVQAAEVYFSCFGCMHSVDCDAEALYEQLQGTTGLRELHLIDWDSIDAPSTSQISQSRKDVAGFDAHFAAFLARLPNGTPMDRRRTSAPAGQVVAGGGQQQWEHDVRARISGTNADMVPDERAETTAASGLLISAAELRLDSYDAHLR